MIQSLVFKTQGRLHSRDIDVFLMPTVLADTDLFLWVDLEDPTEEESRSLLENVFHFHPLSIEDCVQEKQTPKVEEYLPKEGDLFSRYIFMVVHAVDYLRKDGVFATNELNIFLGKNFIVTWHKAPNRGVAQTTELAMRGAKKLARAPDRIAHTLLDWIVNNYRPALEELSFEIAELEQEVLESTNKAALNRLIGLKKEVLHLRQIITPQREVLARLARGEFKLIRGQMMPYFRDVHDGLLKISDTARGYMDSLTSILQVYLSMTSNQTGDVVKLLTLITIITTPIMIVGTWYGMNFSDMPELKSSHGYMIAGGVTLVFTIATFIYFKRKHWF